MINCIILEETKIENLKPIIYISQPFFIDKKEINSNAEEISFTSLYKNITNKYPMRCGEINYKNHDKHLNPRIQINNATCELDIFGKEIMFSIKMKLINKIKSKFKYKK